MQKFIDKNNKDWNDLIRNKYILISEYKVILKKVESKRKKEFNVLFRAINSAKKLVNRKTRWIKVSN